MNYVNGNNNNNNSRENVFAFFIRCQTIATTNDSFIRFWAHRQIHSKLTAITRENTIFFLSARIFVRFICLHLDIHLLFAPQAFSGSHCISNSQSLLWFFLSLFLSILALSSSFLQTFMYVSLQYFFSPSLWCVLAAAVVVVVAAASCCSNCFRLHLAFKFFQRS